MINPACFEKEWIENFRKQREFRRINPPVLEKMIHALYLLQNLKKEGLDFVFKGGTALSKTHNIIQRFSEDIDLVVLIDEGDNDNKLKSENLLRSFRFGIFIVKLLLFKSNCHSFFLNTGTFTTSFTKVK